MDWFVKKWGIRKSQIEIERPFDDRVHLRPTFWARTADFHMLCVEVSESIYNNTLDSAALDCWVAGIPVKLVVAVPRDIQDTQFAAKLKAARRAGVGILEVGHSYGTLIHQPLALSLAGVREIPALQFPARYRESLDHARQTFRDGEPAKACALVFDELEDASRKLAAKCCAKGLWRNQGNLDLQRDSWTNILVEMNRSLDRSTVATKPITPVLISRMIGITAHRNESGHKPRSVKERAIRDQALRTRFESGVDLLRDFLSAVRAFRI